MARKISIALFLGLILLAAGCGRPSMRKVRIGMVTFPGYAPFYLAKDKGLFQGVDVDLVRIEAIGDLRAAMKSGNIDMYLATFDIFESNQGEIPPGVGFLAVDQSNGADGVAVAGGIDSVSDFKGKRVGAEPGFPPYFVLQYALHEAGMSLKDVQFRDIASQDAGSAFVAKQLDVVGTYEPYLSKSVSLRKGSRVLVSSANLPGLVVDLLFASEKLLDETPEVAQEVAKGWFSAVQYYQRHPDESMELMAKSFGVSTQELADMKSRLLWFSLEDNSKLFDAKQHQNVFNTFDVVGEILQSNNPSFVNMKARDKLSSEIINRLGK